MYSYSAFTDICPDTFDDAFKLDWGVGATTPLPAVFDDFDDNLLGDVDENLDDLAGGDFPGGATGRFRLFG